MMADPSNTNPPLRTLILIGGGLVAVGIVPMLFGRSRMEPSVEITRREQIAGMSATERTRFRSDNDTFQQLPPDERTRLRSLHADIQSDPILSATLAEYTEWLRSLPTHQRQRIEDETGADKRLALVLALRDDEKKETPIPFHLGPLRVDVPRGDFDCMMRTLSDSANPQLRQLLNRMPESVPEVKRYQLLYQALFRSFTSESSAGQRQSAQRRFLSATLVTELVDCISVDQLRDRLRSLPTVQQVQFFRDFLRLGIWHDWRPAPEDLTNTFEGMDDDARNQIMQMPPDEAVPMLTRMMDSERFGSADQRRRGAGDGNSIRRPGSRSSSQE